MDTAEWRAARDAVYRDIEDDDDWLGLHDIQALLGMNEDAVYAHLRRHALPVAGKVKVRRRIYIPRPAGMAWVNRHRRRLGLVEIPQRGQGKAADLARYRVDRRTT